MATWRSGRVHGGRAISEFFSGSSSVQRMTALSRELFRDDTARRRKYLAAVEQLLQLRLQQQLQPALACTDIHDRTNSLLDKAMSSLAMEFCYLRIWRTDARSDHRLSISPSSVWESVSRSCSGGGSGSISSGSFTDSASNDGSFNTYYYPSLCEDMTVGVGSRKSSAADMSLFDRKSSTKLRESLSREDMNTCSEEQWINTVLNMPEFLRGGPREMQRQLNGLCFGSFNTFKGDYFLAIAKVSVMKLFKSASSTCIQESPPIDESCKETYAMVKLDISKMVNVVMMYQALNYVMPSILAFFSGQIKDFILAEAEKLSHRLSDMFLKLSVELNNLMRSQYLVITDTGVHRAGLVFGVHAGHELQDLATSRAATDVPFEQCALHASGSEEKHRFGTNPRRRMVTGAP
ncbi:hypothetical protein EJB05_30383, partial [Eragrostis curvula]